jgi:hypothetical protein
MAEIAKLQRDPYPPCDGRYEITVARLTGSACGAVTVTVEVDGSHERSDAGTGRPSTEALRGAVALMNLTVQVRCLT